MATVAEADDLGGTDHAPQAPTPIAARVRRRRLVLGLPVALVVVLLVGLIAWQEHWASWQAGIHAPGSWYGVAQGQPVAGSTSGTGPVRVAYRAGGSLLVDVLLTSDDPISVTKIEFPYNQFLRQRSTIFGESTVTERRMMPLTGAAAFDPSVGGGTWVRTSFAFAGCSTDPDGSNAGVRVTTSWVNVTYRAHHRRRVRQVRLERPFTVVAPTGDACR